MAERLEEAESPRLQERQEGGTSIHLEERVAVLQEEVEMNPSLASSGLTSRHRFPACFFPRACL